MRSLVFAVFSVLAGFVAALPGQVIKPHPSATSTVTADAHPMTFWPLTPLDPTVTPLSYGSPPTASKVPTGPRKEANALPGCTPATTTLAVGQTSASISTPPATSTTIYTVIRGNYPVVTLPAFCRPTLFANAPSLVPPAYQAPLPTAIVTMGANSVPDKASCCAECAGYYNCFAWRFVPSYVGTPSDRLPGGFDPWRHGNCEIAYYTGNGTAENVTRDDAPSICPNGRLRGLLSGSQNAGHDAWLDGLYYNGWNEGACGDVGDAIFLGGGDLGVGDGSSLCSAKA